MRLARKKVINKDELWDAADTIEWVFQAVHFRYKDLQGAYPLTQDTSKVSPSLADIFRQQKLDPRQQFRNFACSLVSISVFSGFQLPLMMMILVSALAEL